MGKIQDLTGQKFGKLTVIERVENSKCGKTQWLCKCECGNKTIVASNSLKTRHTQSCGCIKAEKIEDLTGKRFNRLTVIERTKNYTTKNGKKYAQWLCKCDCGGKIIVRGSSLKNGRIKSCGCINKEKIVKTGEKEKRLYSIWCAIKTRCYNKNAESYKNYGSRGIKMCDEWINNFKSFCDWSLQNGYNNNLTIDRINVDKDYEPSNCRWTTMEEQSNNKRNNHYITYNGKTQSLADWCRELNLDYKTILARINRSNWTPEQALETPTKTPIKMIEYKNKVKPLKQWYNELNLHYGTVCTRLQRGWSVEESFETHSSN